MVLLHSLRHLQRLLLPVLFLKPQSVLQQGELTVLLLQVLTSRRRHSLNALLAVNTLLLADAACFIERAELRGPILQIIRPLLRIDIRLVLFVFK